MKKVISQIESKGTQNFLYTADKLDDFRVPARDVSVSDIYTILKEWYPGE